MTTQLRHEIWSLCPGGKAGHPIVGITNSDP